MSEDDARPSDPSPDPRASAAPIAARRGLPWRAITIALVLGALVLALVLWALRGALVTALLSDALSSRGVRCEGLEVSASATLAHLEIGPTHCDVVEGPIASIAWRDPLEVSLEGGAVSSVRAQTLSIRRRGEGTDPSPSPPSVPLGAWVQAPARIGGVVRFASRLSETDSPELAVQRVEIGREGEHGLELELEGLVAPARAAGSAATLTIAELALASAEGPAGLEAVPRLHDVVVEADRAHGSLEGTLDATLRLPSFGGLSLGTLQLAALTGQQRLRVEAEQLEGPEPRYSVTMSSR